MTAAVIALNTFRESVRDKILYNLVFFAMFLIGASTVLADLTIAEQQKIVTDMGLAAINLVGVIIAIFVGVGLVSKEIDRRTIYTILARPLSRHQFLLGKYAGLMLTLLVNLLIMLFVFLVTLWLTRSTIHAGLFQAVELIYVELVVTTAVALLFSTFTSTTMSATMSLGCYIIGHLTSDLRAIADKVQAGAVRGAAVALYYLCPNLEALNIKGLAAAGNSVSLSYQFAATLYGALYAALLLTVACIIFHRRDF